MSSRKTFLSLFLSILMFSNVAAAATSVWNGPSGLSGATRSITDAFEVPGNATVIDAWLHVDESGYLEDGSGITWTGEDIPNNSTTGKFNFSAGQFSDSMMGKFDGAMSLTPDSAVSNVDTFVSGSLQLPGTWSQAGNIWQAVNPSGLGGTVTGSSRALAHGIVPASAADGALVAGTLPGQALPSSTSGALIMPAISIPNPINHFNLSFSHWHHLDIKDGAWVEYKLDNGNWTYLEPVGGYSSSISTNATTPLGANGSGFGVFGDGNHSSWMNSIFNLDNLTGISAASQIQFRFQVWTDSNNILRPGWFIDDFIVQNVGNSSGLWHHGCYSTATTCSYSNLANGALESSIDLSASTNGAKIVTELEFDLEGSSWDNFCVELSTNNGSSWTDISSTTNNTTTSCRSRSGAIPGSGYTLPNGATVGDDSGGFVELEFSIPSSMIGFSGSAMIRYVTATDGSVGYGGAQDAREGLSVRWFEVENAGNTVFSKSLSTISSANHYGINGAIDDWSFQQIGQGGMSITYSLEDSTSLPPGGWTITNLAGQTGWEFGSICSSYTGGPSAFPSASLGFGTNLCGNYDSNSDNSLISPEYSVPLGASARFVWKHWMCAESNYDGGILYYSVNSGPWTQAYVNYATGGNWYDGRPSSGPFSGSDVWDGRQHSACGSTSPNIPWADMAYDVSNLSGNNVSFKFRHGSDSSVVRGGWYVDNIGLEVDWFETEGSWTSPLISTHDLGNGFVDADIILPNNTWYGVNILDATGQVINGHENMSLPVSLASIDRDVNPDIHIEILMGTNDEYFTPLVRELTVGATRYFGEDNGWNVPSSLVRNSDGTWENTLGVTQVIAGVSGFSSRPISSAIVTGNFTSATASLITVGAQTVSATANNSVLDLGGMRTHISPKVSVPPGAIINSLAFRGVFAQPAHDASIDLADDGVIDWSFSSSPSYGSYGWQTRLDSTSTSHSASVVGNDSLSVLVPESANIHTLLLGLNANGPTEPLTISSGGNSFYQLSSPNWSTSVIKISNPQLSSSNTHVDSSGRNWDVIDIQLNSSPTTSFNVGSIAIGYNLLENVSGLGPSVKAYHESNSGNGLASIVDVPLTWQSAAGGVAIDGGVYHENMITNHPFNVPVTWYPNSLLQGFSTQHHHLLGNENIAYIHLIGLDSSGDTINVNLTDIQSGGTFTQISGFGMLKLDNTTSVSEIGGRIVVDWQFEVDWDWNDSQSISWSAQGYDAEGEGLSPATALSGGVGIRASENDLQVDSWEVSDLFGHDLSDMYSPSYPFWAMSGSQVSVSGTVRFENTLDMRPIKDDFVVAVDLDGEQVILSSMNDGQWTGLVTLPSNYSQVNITPYVFRVGPITGASGAEDSTLTTPVNILLDTDSPWVSNLQVNNGQRLLAADGFTWDPSSSLSLQVTVTDNQALGDKLTMNYWREVVDDSNGDGIANESEYQTTSENLPEGVTGERTLTFSGIDVSGLEMNGLFSVYFTGTDYAGHQLMYGGNSGIDNDMATLIIAINEPTEIPSTSLSMNTVNEQLLVGQRHTLSMSIGDANGVNSVDKVTVKLLGADEDEVGVMNWEPRNGDMYTPENSQVTLHDVKVTEQGEYSLIEWDFSLDWDFNETLMPEYALPGIVVYDDDDLNPVVLMTNLGSIRWQLDNNLQVVVDTMSDNTPPISLNSSTQIYVQPGDDITFSGSVVFEKSGAVITNLPEQGLEIGVSVVYGSVPIQAYSEVGQNGSWGAGLVLPSRKISDDTLVVDYHITGVPAPGQDTSDIQTLVTMDDVSPIVQYLSAPLILNDDELDSLSFSVQITEDGGMHDSDLVVNWAFQRNGMIMDKGQSSSTISFISENSGIWSYVGSIDFTEGVNVSLEKGDELMWWLEVIDKAGNEASGTGLSMIDAMNTDFTVLSTDVTVTSIEISLADGTAPRGNEVVEGTEIAVVVNLRNLGTKPGTVTVSLMEDMGESRSWLSHGSVELSPSPGQIMMTIPLLYETHGAGQQNLYVNVTGMDQWIDNSLIPHCYAIQDNATCSLNVEADMPRVISQDDAESGFDGASVFNIILIILLIGAGFAIVVLMRRDNSDESIFYDDDEWEDEEEEELYSAKVTPEIPDIAPTQLDVEAASNALSSPVLTSSEELNEMETDNEPAVVDDPWSEVDHSSDAEDEEVTSVEDSELSEAVENVVEDNSIDDTLDSEEELVVVNKKRKPVRGKTKSRKVKTQEETIQMDDVVEDTNFEELEADEVDEKPVVDYKSMTVAQLKDQLRTRGLPLKGKKSELIARLEE